LEGFAYPSPTRAGETETWNGTSWTEVNDMNTASGGRAGQNGTQTAAITAGSGPGIY
jgi:hypothetical protein